MAYLFPRAVIALIAWGTTCLVMNTFTNVAPLVFYIAGGVWSLVGLASFSYMHGLRDDADLEPTPILMPVRASAE